MPNGMTPEKSEVPISPSVQALKEQRWQSELPDIKMQLPNDQTGKEEDITNLFRWLSSMRMATTSSGRFGTELAKLEKATSEGEKEVSREKMRQLYDSLMGQCINAVSGLYPNCVDQKKNIAPFEDKGPRMTIEAVRESLLSLAEEEWFKSEEARVWLDRVEEDLDYLEAFLRTTTALSASLPGYFDIIVQLSTLKDHYRAFATEDTFEKTFIAQMDGLCLRADKTKQEISDQQKIGLKVETIYKSNGESLIKPEETVGLRELAIRIQDASFESRMKLAAVSQVDFKAADREKTTFMGDKLTKEELEFYRELFWTHKYNAEKGKGKGYIFTPYITSKAKERKEIFAKMEAILVTNATERLRGLSSLQDVTEREAKLSTLIKDVKAEALKRLAAWHKRGKDNVSRLAILLTQGGLLQDYSLMHAYRYCWGYLWETDEGGNPLRKSAKSPVEIGGIYTYSGDIPSLGWGQRKHKYDEMGNSATTFLLPTSRAGRKEVKALSPFEMPQYTPDIAKYNDDFLRAQWNFLFGTDTAAKNERAEMGYKDIEPTVAAKLQEWAFAWTTPFTDTFLLDINARESHKSVQKELVVPHFMPPRLDMANFFEAVTVQDEKLSEGAESIWDELVSGKKLSEINWAGMDFQQIDRYLVDCEMASRYMRILIEVFDKDKDPFFTLVTGSPSTLGPKELAKRLRLSLRDSPEGKITMYEVAFIPWFVVLAVADRHGIFGASAWEQSTREERESAVCAADRFFMEMAYWKRAFKWLPGDRPDLEDIDNLDYGNTMALLAEYYEAVISRVAISSSEEAFALAKENYNRTAERLNSLRHLRGGRFNYSINKDRALKD